MSMKNVFALALTAVALAAGSAAQAVTNFRLAHAGPETSSQHLAALEFVRLVKERTKGEVNIRIYGSSVLGNDQATISGLRGGTIDIVMAGNPNFTGIVSKLNALDLPFIFDDAAHAYRVLDGAVGQQLLDELGKYNIKGLAFWEVGWRCITNNKRPIRTPEDVRGLKIRTTPNPAHIRAFEALGANPVPLALGELYTALETGAVDAREHPVEITWSAKFYEVQKHLSMTRHAYTALILAINKTKFDALPPAQQKALVDASREAAKFQRDLNTRNESQIVAELKKKGMQVVETVDAAPFRKVLLEKVKQTYLDKNGPEVLTAIDAARK
jgi:tripartite ATP-independent transporter DctP family solute receptor